MQIGVMLAAKSASAVTVLSKRSGNIRSQSTRIKIIVDEQSGSEEQQEAGGRWQG
jgi:hypothetical protein